MVDSINNNYFNEYNIIKTYPSGSRSIVEKNVSGRIGAILEAARKHGGYVLKPKKVGGYKWVVADEQGNIFHAE